MGISRPLLISVLCSIFAAGLYSFFLNAYAPDIPLAILSERWAKPPSSFVNVRGVQVHIRESGERDGSPIVLLHGTSADLHTWDDWTTALVASGYSVLAMDIPAFGLTGPNIDGNYTIQYYAEFVVEVLDKADFRSPVALAGNSLGGQIALEVALQYPHRVNRLILLDAAGTSTPWLRLPVAFVLAQVSRSSLIFVFIAALYIYVTL